MDAVELTQDMGKIEIPTVEEAEWEARSLVFRLMLCPGSFTLLDLARLQEILIAEGYMD